MIVPLVFVICQLVCLSLAQPVIIQASDDVSYFRTFEDKPASMTHDLDHLVVGRWNQSDSRTFSTLLKFARPTVNASWTQIQLSLYRPSIAPNDAQIKIYLCDDDWTGSQGLSKLPTEAEVLYTGLGFLGAETNLFTLNLDALYAPNMEYKTASIAMSIRFEASTGLSSIGIVYNSAEAITNDGSNRPRLIFTAATTTTPTPTTTTNTLTAQPTTQTTTAQPTTAQTTTDVTSTATNTQSLTSSASTTVAPSESRITGPEVSDATSSTSNANVDDYNNNVDDGDGALGAIVGGAVGGVVLLLIVCIVLVIVIVARRRRKSSIDAFSQPQPIPDKQDSYYLNTSHVVLSADNTNAPSNGPAVYANVAAVTDRSPGNKVVYANTNSVPTDTITGVVYANSSDIKHK